MTLRTTTYDTATHKIVPIEPTNEINAAIDKEMILQFGKALPDQSSPWHIYKAGIAAAPEYQQIEMPEDLQQDWKGMDGAIAYHLIDRHADNWGDVGQMMGAWLKANQEPVKDE